MIECWLSAWRRPCRSVEAMQALVLLLPIAAMPAAAAAAAAVVVVVGEVEVGVGKIY
jgi:hypothetical protein